MMVESNFVEKEIAVNVRYVTSTQGLRMIVDSSAPLLVVSEKWMNRYMREMKMDPEDMEGKE